MKDAAVVRGDIVSIEEETFLHWQTVSHELYAGELARGLTSLEAGDRSGYLYTSGKKVR